MGDHYNSDHDAADPRQASGTPSSGDGDMPSAGPAEAGPGSAVVMGDNSAAVEQARPSVWLAPWLLVARPARFFTWFADYPMWLLLVFGYLVGIMKVLDRVQGEYGFGQSRWPMAHESWSALWAIMLAGGILAGAMHVLIGGWWYKVRIQWSGGEVADQLHLKVWCVTWLLAIVPALLILFVEMSLWEAPRVAYDAEPVWISLIVPLIYMVSLYHSYRGARLLFGVKRWPAIGWLVALPGVFNAGVIIALIGVVLWTSALIKPDLENQSVFESNTMRFRYPGNWGIDRSAAEFDPETSVGILPRQDAYMGIYLGEAATSLADELAWSRQQLIDVSSLWEDEKPITEWAGHAVEGVRATAEIDGETYQVTLALRWVGPGWLLETRELVRPQDIKLVQPGFDAINNSFKLTLADLDQVETPAQFKSNTMSIDYPASWWIEEDRFAHNADADVMVEAPYDAFTQLFLYESTQTATAELADSHESLAVMYGELEDIEPLEQWGVLEGMGFTARVTPDEAPYRVRVFLHEAGLNMMFEVWEMHLIEQAEEVEPAFKTIEDSFKLQLQQAPTGAWLYHDRDGRALAQAK